MTLVQKTDYVQEAQGRLLSQYRDKPRIAALVASWVQGAQALEDEVWALRLGMLIDNAQGALLDVIGAIVGQAREGKSDPVYRVWVAARVLVNRSSGVTEQVIAIVRALVPSGVTVTADEHYPAAFRIRAGTVALPSNVGQAIGEILQLAKAAGVRGLFEFSLVDDDATFAFSASGTTEDASTHGFGAGLLSAVTEGVA